LQKFSGKRTLDTGYTLNLSVLKNGKNSNAIFKIVKEVTKNTFNNAVSSIYARMADFKIKIEV
jgi:hypothetical protein